jgi:hypothetical protein
MLLDAQVDRLATASTRVTALVTSCEQEFARRRSKLGSSLLERMALFQQRQAAEALAFQQELMALHEQEMDDLQEAHALSLREVQATLLNVKVEKEARAQAQDAEQRKLSNRLREADERVLQVAQGLRDLGQSLQTDLTQVCLPLELAQSISHAPRLTDSFTLSRLSPRPRTASPRASRP